METIKKYIQAGKLKKARGGFFQVETLLKEAVIDLDEVEKIRGLVTRAVYILSYMAMLKAGRALLLCKGYRPADGAQHKTVVEMTSLFLDDRLSHVTNYFDIMRRKRNDMTYEGSGLVSESECEEAVNDAYILVQEVIRMVKDEHPQLEIFLKHSKE